MALGATAKLPVIFQLGETALGVITGAGEPDGNSDPQLLAVKGSLYVRTDATDDEPPLWVKVDDDGADDDWVPVLVNKNAAAMELAAALTMGTDKKLYFRDTGLYIYSNADGELTITADSKIYLGDGTNQLGVADNGVVSMEGTAKVTRIVPLPIATGGGTATIEEFNGAPSINLDADTETFLASAQIPGYDGAGDLTIKFMVANEIAEDDGDDVSITCQVRGYADGETSGDAGQSVACTLNLTGGDEAINVVNEVSGTIDYNHGTYPIAAGDTVVIEAVVNLAGGGECTGPLHVVRWWLEYSANALA